MSPWEGVMEFVAVAKTASFTAASKRLGISTAQVSRQVSQLENRLQTKLFYRTTRKVSLTEEGAVYFRHCEQVLDGLAEAERAISSLQQEPRGLIRITAPVTYGERFVMPAIIDFMQQYPQVEVVCELTNRQLDLVAGGYDLAIRLGYLVDSSMMAKRLASRTQYVCAAPSYITEFGQPTSLAQLADHNCLVGTHSHWSFTDKTQTYSIKVAGNLRCNSGFSLFDAALKGIGLVQLPDYYVSQALKQGKLVSILDEFQPEQEGIWALYPQNRHLSTKVRLLMAHLTEAL
ncbi:LysR family transcriptional regulator [Shewanella sp. WXL01]|uniref:LysR substrate-binding domain-containing protein n=1 Tax=Shewanella sp. WXL01 TaxID=2709721 RepID=UPI0014382EE0|nr:LysR substrate-binding domain-containing protein [Shewanella sp. WXL01]NKF51874.1 LysR family transcriptional regulator [Shewanella sp. WXL01]